MEATQKQQGFFWFAASHCLAEVRPLSPFTYNSFPRIMLQRLFWGFQGRRLLILLLLLMTVHDQRQALLDCGSCRRTPLWIVGVRLVTASSVFRALNNAPESSLLYQLLEATSSVVQQRLTPPQPSSEVQPRLTTRLHFPITAGNLRVLHVGTQESGHFTMVTRSSPTRSRSEYTAMAGAESAASSPTGVVTEARSALANLPRPDEGMGTYSGSVIENTASSDTPIGESMKEAANDQLLESKSVITAVRNEVGDSVGEQVLRQQLHAEGLQAPKRLEQTGLPLRGKPFSNISLLANGLLMSAKALPDSILHDKVAGQRGQGKGGGAAEQGPSHIPHGWLIGILSCLLGAFCGSLGDNMVRRSFVVLNEHDKLSLFQMWRSPLWSMGMFLTIVVNTICSMIGLAFAPATVVTSFAGVHIFWNTLLAKTLNREKATIFDYVGIVAVILGIVLIVVFSGGEHAIDSAQAFVSNLSSPGPVVYILSVVVLITVGSALDCCPTVLPWCRNVAANMDGNYGRGARLAERFLLAVTSGACGGLSNLLAKATILMFDTMPHAVPDAESAQGAPASLWLLLQKYTHLDWSACFLVALTGGVAAAQLLFLNASLRKFEAIYVVPIINSVLIVTGALGGILLFREVPAQCAPFTLGVMSVVVGVSALSYGKYEAEQYVLQQSQHKETPLRNIGGREPGDPLLQREPPSEVPLEEHRREDTYTGPISQVQGWCDSLFRPLTDASVNILVRTNTLNSTYPVGLLNIAHHDSNASIRIFRQTTPDLSDANEGPEPPLDSLTKAFRREEDNRFVRNIEARNKGGH